MTSNKTKKIRVTITLVAERAAVANVLSTAAGVVERGCRGGGVVVDEDGALCGTIEIEEEAETPGIKPEYLN